MPSLIITLGGTIAAVCSRCQSQRNYEFAMDSWLQAEMRAAPAMAPTNAHFANATRLADLGFGGGSPFMAVLLWLQRPARPLAMSPLNMCSSRPIQCRFGPLPHQSGRALGRLLSFRHAVGTAHNPLRFPIRP